MILGELKKTSEKVTQYLTVANYKVDINHIKKIENDLNELNKDIVDLTKIIEEIMVKIDKPVDVEYDLLNKIEEIKSEIKKGESYELISVYIEQIKEEISSLDAECLDSWKRHYTENYRDLLGTLNLLREVINDNEITNIRFNISRYEGKWPIEKLDIEKLKYLKKKADEKIKSLEMGKEIENFLLKIISGQGRVSDLTDNILNWLRRNNADGNVELRIIVE